MRDVLPAPLGPRRPKMLPFAMWIDTSSNALWLAYCFTMFLISSIKCVSGITLYDFDERDPRLLQYTVVSLGTRQIRWKHSIIRPPKGFRSEERRVGKEC